MGEGQNQTGQAAAGSNTSEDSFSTADIVSTAKQILEQLKNVKTATERLDQKLSTAEHLGRIEEIKTAVSELERLIPQTWMEDKLFPQTEKIKDAITQLTDSLSQKAWEDRIKSIQDTLEAMITLAKQEKETAEKLAHDTLPSKAREQFQKEIDAACYLLNFAITEGRPGISDSMIEQITKAQRFLDNNIHPTWSDYTTFAKAYRELSLVLSPINAELLRKQSPLQWLHTQWVEKKYGGLLGVGVLLVFLLSVFSLLGVWICSQQNEVMGCASGPEQTIDCPPCSQRDFAVLTAIVGSGFVGFLGWGLYVFTGLAPNKKLIQIIRFCYVFTILSLVIAILPFFIFLPSPKLLRVMALSPISIIKGCSKTASPQSLSPQGPVPPRTQSVPQEIWCFNEGNEGKGENEGNEKKVSYYQYQWVINIGGKADLVSQQDKLEKTGKKGESSQVQGSTENQPSGASQGQQTKSREEGKGTTLANQQDLQDQDDLWEIQGGLVVPLYVVVLALMGSAVSMTRRVPEYQRRALDPKETVTNPQAREWLMFQIMQVLSAPLIAMTAYYLYGPDTQVKSVFLGFASGFASEPILLSIRRLAEKLAPAEVGSPLVIAVTVSPGQMLLEAGKTATFVATVTSTTNPDVTWSITPSDTGEIDKIDLITARYTAPKETDAKKIVTIVARSAADPTKSGTATVELNPSTPSQSDTASTPKP